MKCLSILKASYPRQNLEKATIETYAAMLQDIEFEAAMGAVNRLVSSSKWFPSIAEIRAECTADIRSELPDPEQAWGEVQRAIGRWGMNRLPEWSCAQVGEAVDCVGWRTICLDENVMSTRRVFLDAYKGIRERVVTRAQLGAHAPKRRELTERSGYGRLAPVLELAEGEE
jgi:hypothetical protein